MTIHWQSDAARRAGLTADELELVSLSAESGYDATTVQRFLDALSKPPAPPAPLRPAPRVVYAAVEIDKIIERHPEHFGRRED